MKIYPITKICIMDNRGSTLTSYLQETVENLGFKNEVYKVDGKMYNSEDCSHLLSYVYKLDKNNPDKNKLVKVSYFLYNLL